MTRLALLAAAVVAACVSLTALAQDPPQPPPQPPPAQQQPPPPRAQRFRAGVELISLNVAVAEAGRFVTDLEETEFEVFEDGVKQNVSFFSRMQQPIARE